MREFKVIFCVFAGRERFMNILNRYIIKLLDKNLIDEYHIMNFTRNINDSNYLEKIHKELNDKFNNRIFLHFTDENKILLENNQNNKALNINQKNVNSNSKWDYFYKNLGKSICDENSIIIKCDDDILFIDINKFEEVCYKRWNDRESFVIHSNCINNGVCTYFQKEYFPKISQFISEYPKGGICGPIFENPELSAIIHYEFCNSLLLVDDYSNILKKYYLDSDKYITTRISINFVFLHGKDIPYLNLIGKSDEYELSSKIPEYLMRPNRIIGDFVTSHYSYGNQDRILKNRKDLIDLYDKLSLKNIKIDNNFDIININNSIKVKSIQYILNNNNEVYKVKNPLNNNDYKIKNVGSNKYLYYEKESNTIKLEKDRYNYYTIKNKREILYGIYPLTKYNIPNNFINDLLYAKCMLDKREKEIEFIEKDNTYIIYLKKHDVYLMEENSKLIFKSLKHLNKEEIYEELEKDYYRWIIDNEDSKREYIEVERIIKDYEKERITEIKSLEINYIDRETGMEITNPYYGWKLETILNIH